MEQEHTGQSLPPGTRLEEFEILRVLGAGGFGITYLAKDTILGRTVVIKENLPVQFCFRHPESLTVAPRHSHGDDAASFQWSLESFSREAATLASLDHPGIVKVLRSFPAFGTAYFVMPFVEGMALDGVIQQREARGERFAEEELLGLLNRLLDALGHLHANGIYHRDIKPGNILITRNGIPVLIDFGSARQLVSERSMTVIESPGYTPFEQLQSRGNVGPWSDIYALAGTVYKMLTFQTPPKAMDRVRDDPVRSLTTDMRFAGHYGHGFLAALDRAFRFDERDRWQSAAEWQAALLTQTVSNPAIHPTSPVGPPKRTPVIPPPLPVTPPPLPVTPPPLPAAPHSHVPPPPPPSEPQSAAVNPAPSGVPKPGKPKSSKGLVGVLAGCVVLGVVVWAVTSGGKDTEAAKREKAEAVRVAKEQATRLAKAEADELEARERRAEREALAREAALEAERRAAQEAEAAKLAVQMAAAQKHAREAEERAAAIERERIEEKEAEVKRLVGLANAAKSVLEFSTGGVGDSREVGIGGSEKLSLKYVPGGKFTMGSPDSEKGRYGDEKQVEVELTSHFWMAETEITQSQWESVMGSNPGQFKGDKNLPVEQVSWDDAQAFVSELNGQGALPDGWRWSLPTEAQWERACRGGTSGPHAGALDEMAWYSSTANGKTGSVGMKKANRYGLHDMHGNVWEWCLDWYATDFKGGKDPSGPKSGSIRVFRGGGWNGDSYLCRSAIRSGSTPDVRDSRLGLRVVVVPPP